MFQSSTAVLALTSHANLGNFDRKRRYSPWASQSQGPSIGSGDKSLRAIASWSFASRTRSSEFSSCARLLKAATAGDAEVGRRSVCQAFTTSRVPVVSVSRMPARTASSEPREHHKDGCLLETSLAAVSRQRQASRRRRSPAVSKQKKAESSCLAAGSEGARKGSSFLLAASIVSSAGLGPLGSALRSVSALRATSLASGRAGRTPAELGSSRRSSSSIKPQRGPLEACCARAAANSP